MRPRLDLSRLLQSLPLFSDLDAGRLARLSAACNEVRVARHKYLVLVDKHTILAELNQDTSFARRMLAGLAMRVHTLMEDIETVSIHNAQQRVIWYLLNLPRNGNRACFSIRKSIVASKLSVAPSTLTRTLQMLVEARLISVSGPEVVVHDWPALEYRLRHG